MLALSFLRKCILQLLSEKRLRLSERKSLSSYAEPRVVANRSKLEHFAVPGQEDIGLLIVPAVRTRNLEPFPAQKLYTWPIVLIRFDGKAGEFLNHLFHHLVLPTKLTGENFGSCDEQPFLTHFSPSCLKMHLEKAHLQYQSISDKTGSYETTLHGRSFRRHLLLTLV